MKSIAIVSVFVLILAGAAVSLAQDLTADEVIKKVDDLLYSKTAKSTTKQIITTSSGEVREYVIEGISMDGTDKTMSTYIKPAKVKGVRILTLNDGDDIWTYFPRTGRVRKIASSAKKQKVMGSDFSYEDFGSGKFETNYTAKLLESEKEADRQCYKLEMIPKPDGPSYSKIIAWVDMENFTSYRVDYYDEDGLLLKRLVISDYKDIQGHPTPMKMAMINLQEGGKTEMVTVSTEYDIPLSADDFSDSKLAR